jgi:hypothetical protein
MLKIFEKVGKNAKVVDILRCYGWKGKKGTLVMQKYRGSITTDVALILWDYCNRHNIPVSIEDFKAK